MIRVAGYCRVSTDRDDQANSFDAQQRYFREYISRQPGWELYEIYADEGITGTSTKKRIRFNAMIRDARAGQFSLILTKEVSRFSRNILDTIAFTRELRSLGVGVIFLTDGISTLDPDAELRLSIMASIAQEESRKTSARVKWGQTRQMERGVVFGHSLLGYDVRNGVMTVNPAGAEIVRLIFHKYAVEKKGTSVIARELREAGIRTISGNPHWSNSHILKILKNEKYMGDLIQKKTCTPDYLTHEKKVNSGGEELVILRDHHEPIISHELWDGAQVELARRNRHSTAEGHSNRYPLSGKIRCGECGGVFISRQKKRSDGTSYKRWGCITAANHGNSGCNIGRMLRDDTAMGMLGTVLASLEVDREAIIRQVLNDADSGQDEITGLMRTLERIRQKRETALDEYLSGNLTTDELNGIRTRYDREACELEKRLEACRESAVYNALYNNERNLRERVNRILDGGTNCIGFWQNLVESVVIYRDGRVTVTLRELEMKWIFALDGCS